MKQSLTRVLVLSGMVALTNAYGAVVGDQDGLPAAVDEAGPVHQAADATNDFGFELLRHLTRSDPGQDLVFSPYSVHAALSMAAEGARGETAEELALVLGLPTGPLERSGFAQLHDTLSSLGAQDQSALEAEIAEARRLLVLLRSRLGQAAEGDESYRLRREEAKLVDTLSGLEARLKTYRVRVANALWGERTAPFAEAYVARVDATFRTGAIVPANFRGDPAGEVTRINRWVEEATGGLIPQLVTEEHIQADTRLVLLNAVHFLGDWVRAFDPEKTRPQEFTRTDGVTFEVPMMRRDGLKVARIGAFRADGSAFPIPKEYDPAVGPVAADPGTGGFMVLELPYRGEDLAFVVLLPRDTDGLADLAQRLDGAPLRTWLGQLQDRKLDLRLPRFEAEAALELRQPLIDMGLATAFSPPSADGGADFTGMTEGIPRSQSLYFTHAVHRAVLAVDERGTVAAAATALVGRFGGRPRLVSYTPTFEADHPFLFLVMERSTGATLFAGTVEDPR